jgi:hypothetical protein
MAGCLYVDDVYYGPFIMGENESGSFNVFNYDGHTPEIEGEGPIWADITDSWWEPRS